MSERVKRYINERAISQKLIAANMGIPESRLSLILNGKRRMTVEDYEGICRAMAINPTHFFVDNATVRTEDETNFPSA